MGRAEVLSKRCIRGGGGQRPRQVFFILQALVVYQISLRVSHLAFFKNGIMHLSRSKCI